MRRLERILIFLLCGLSQGMTVAAQAADTEPAYRHSLSVLGGGYSLGSPARSSTSFGSLSLGYGYQFTENWKGIAAYNSILSTEGGVGSFVNGFDGGVQYCFFSCTATRRQVGDLLEITERSSFGLALGAGLAQRAFQLTSATLSFSGPFFKAELNYFWSERLKILGAVQLTSLANGPNSLTFQTVSVGFGLDW